MVEFIRAGGYPTIVTLVFGVIILVLGGLFVWRPSERRYRVLKAMSTATCFSVIGGVCSNFAAVMSKVPNHPEWSKSPDVHLIVMYGIGEALTTAILGFTILSLAWLMAAVGQRRLV
jgi:hypothetical protein